MKYTFSLVTVRIVLFGLLFFLQGCADSNLESEAGLQSAPLFQSKVVTAASNPQNPYDSYGQVMDSLVARYSLQYTPTKDLPLLAERVLGLMQKDAFYQEVYSKTPSSLSLPRISSFLAQPSISAEIALERSTLRTDVQVILRNFITTYSELVLSSAGDSTVFESVREFEASVLASTYYSPYERQELLQAASVARYTAYRKRKRPKKNTDPDWTVLIVHIASSIDATVTDPTERIYQSLVTGIASNAL